MMGNTKHKILIIIYSCIDQAKTHYTRPSRRKIQKLLSQRHATNVGIRWISRCIKYLVDEEYISRQMRYVRYGAGQVLQIPSLFAFKLKGAGYLFSNQIRGAAKLLTAIRAFIKKNDKRWPAKEFEDVDTYRKLYNEDQTRVKDLRGL